MNERIDELIGKALDQAVPYTWHHLNRVQMDDVMKKFAELILAECMETLRLVPYDSDREFGDEVIYQERLKKHFGVEE